MKRKATVYIFLALLSVFLFVSCDDKEAVEESKVYYTITFDSNGGSDIASQQVEAFTKVGVPSDPFRSKYIFKGWYNGDTLWNFLTEVSSDLVLTARWEKTKVKVSFRNIVEDVTGTVPEDFSCEWGTSYNLPDSSTLSKTGYEFLGWYLTPYEDDESKVLPGENLIINENTVIYAVWKGVVSTECSVKTTIDTRKQFSSFFDFDPNWFILPDSDNESFNADICMFMDYLACDIYDNITVSLKDAPYSSSSVNADLKIYEQLGFSDFSKTKMRSSNYTEDKNDISSYILAHKEYTVEGKTVSLVVLTVEGTDGSSAQWSSNCDAGADCSGYYEKNGTEHSLWTNKKRHKGFSVVAARIKEKTDEYLNGITADRKVLLITGHSRGAAVSNILGADYEDEKSDTFKSFVYTFATPTTTCEDFETRSKYKTVFNIINADDFITAIPPKNIGFERYGTTLETDMTSSVMKNYFYRELGIRYSESRLKHWKNDLCLLSDSRDEVYEYKETVRPIPVNGVINYEDFLRSGLDEYLEFTNGKITSVMPALVYAAIPVCMDMESDVAIGCFSLVERMESYGTNQFAKLVNDIISNKDGIEIAHRQITYLIIGKRLTESP